MSTPNPLAPIAIAVLQGIQQLIANVGSDPATVALKFPGAVTVFIGSLQLALPGLAATELANLETEANTKLAALIAKLQAPPAA